MRNPQRLSSWHMKDYGLYACVKLFSAQTTALSSCIFKTRAPGTRHLQPRTAVRVLAAVTHHHRAFQKEKSHPETPPSWTSPKNCRKRLAFDPRERPAALLRLPLPTQPLSPSFLLPSGRFIKSSIPENTVTTTVLITLLSLPPLV